MSFIQPNIVSDYFLKLENKFSLNISAYPYAILAQTLYTFSSFGIRNSSKVPTSQLMFYRSVIGIILSYLYITSAKAPFYYNSSKTNKMLMTRGLLSILTVFLTFYGFQRTNLSEAISIFQVAPVVTTIFGVIVLKETCNLAQAAVTVLSMGGVLLILKPFSFFTSVAEEGSYDIAHIIGNSSILAATFTFSFSAILAKQMIVQQKIDPQVTTFYKSLFMLFVGSVGVMIEGMKELNTEEMLNIGFISIFNFLADFFNLRAMKFGEAGKVVLMSYVGIPLGYVLDIFIMGNAIELWSTFGFCLIFSCLFIQVFQDKITSAFASKSAK